MGNCRFHQDRMDCKGTCMTRLGWVAIAVAGGITAAAGMLLCQVGLPTLWALFLWLNVATMVCYGYDKYQALTGRCACRRQPCTRWRRRVEPRRFCRSDAVPPQDARRAVPQGVLVHRSRPTACVAVVQAYLLRILTDYFDYHHNARGHLALDRNSPNARSVEAPTTATQANGPEYLLHFVDSASALRPFAAASPPKPAPSPPAWPRPANDQPAARKNAPRPPSQE